MVFIGIMIITICVMLAFIVYCIKDCDKLVQRRIEKNKIIEKNIEMARRANAQPISLCELRALKRNMTERTREVFERVMNAGGYIEFEDLCLLLPNRSPRSIQAIITLLEQKGLVYREKEETNLGDKIYIISKIEVV